MWTWWSEGALGVEKNWVMIWVKINVLKGYSPPHLRRPLTRSTSARNAAMHENMTQAGGPETLTATPFRDRSILTLHQVSCEEVVISCDVCWVKPFQLPMVSLNNHIEWSWREAESLHFISSFFRTWTRTMGYPHVNPNRWDMEGLWQSLGTSLKQ